MEALKLYGTLWFPGVGAKARMRDNSVRIDAKCEVQLREPDSGNRHFGCYKHWQDAIDGLAHIVGHGRHLFEIITHGRPCKPYLDLDGDEMPPGFESIQQVADRAQDLVTRIAKEDYGIDLQPEAFAWLHSGLQAKVSLHLVVSTHAPQFVFHSNHQADAQGALHLAQRIKQLDPDGVGSLVDLAVYTKDREMRMAFSTKYEKKQSMLVPMDPGKAMRDTVITWLDDDVQIINVPLHIPRAVKAASRGFKNPREAKGQTMPGHDPKDPSHLGFVRARMLDLLHERLHPSAFHEAAHGVEDPYDPLRGVKFGFSDRSESCYTGHTHPGAQNMRCFVGDASEVYLKCFSESCQDRPAFRIGPLHAEPETWSAHAVRVRMKYLDWEKQAEPPSEIDDDTDAERLDIAVRDWAAGRFKALNIRSPMATGKSTLLHGVLETLFRGKSVLIVTYRQTLAYEMSRKLDSLGFVSYLDQDGPLHDREVYPRVICQVDSFQRLAPLFGVPSFDVVILDEIESVLRHFGSATLAAPISVMESFVSMIETATSVLSMDAFWGAAAHDFIERCGVTQRLVINEYRGAPRTFVFDDDENAWQERIRSDLVGACKNAGHILRCTICWLRKIAV